MEREVNDTTQTDLPDDVQEAIDTLREAVTVLDEPFHRLSIEAAIDSAADVLERESRGRLEAEARVADLRAQVTSLVEEMRGHSHDLAALSAENNTNAQAASQQMAVWADRLSTLIAGDK